jgi:uncharacterized protein DUF3226
MSPVETANPLKQHVILCEGSGDDAFFRHLIEVRALPDFRILTPRFVTETRGIDAFKARLQALKLERGFEAIRGLVIFADNDGDPGSSFGNVRSQVEAAGDFGIPNRPLAVAKSRNQFPSVVIYMMPSEDQKGRLETLCLVSMREAHAAASECIDQLAVCTGADKWEPHKKEKMLLRAMIATICTEDPNTSLTYAWSRKVDLIPLSHPCFDPIAKFLSDFPSMIAAS